MNKIILSLLIGSMIFANGGITSRAANVSLGGGQEEKHIVVEYDGEMKDVTNAINYGVQSVTYHYYYEG